MKKILFYSLLLFQIIFICLFALQYQLIDKFGNEFTIKIDQSKYKEDYYSSKYARLDLEIETITSEQWQIQKPTYKEKIYVVLKKDEDNIYQVDRASRNKPTVHSDEIVLRAKYLYSNVGKYTVEYGGAFELRNKDGKTDINLREPIFVTYKIAPWNQVKFIELTN